MLTGTREEHAWNTQWEVTPVLRCSSVFKIVWTAIVFAWRRSLTACKWGASTPMQCTLQRCLTVLKSARPVRTLCSEAQHSTDEPVRYVPRFVHNVLRNANRWARMSRCKPVLQHAVVARNLASKWPRWRRSGSTSYDGSELSRGSEGTAS